MFAVIQIYTKPAPALCGGDLVNKHAGQGKDVQPHCARLPDALPERGLLTKRKTMNKNINGYDKKITDELRSMSPSEKDYDLRHDEPIGFIKNKNENNTRAVTIEMLLWMWPEHKKKIMEWDSKHSKKAASEWRKTECYTLGELINCVLGNRWIDTKAMSFGGGSMPDLSFNWG